MTEGDIHLTSRGREREPHQYSGEIEIPDVAIMVSHQLVTQLQEWSEPVQVRIVRAPGAATGWEMEIRSVPEESDHA
jgi:hypothetical protein